MKTYNITFSHVGYATVKAESEEEAWQKAEAMGKEDIEWADSFEATDIEEADDD